VVERFALAAKSSAITAWGRRSVVEAGSSPVRYRDLAQYELSLALTGFYSCSAKQAIESLSLV